jgi:hypothetical protein
MKNKLIYLPFALLTYGLLYFWHPEVMNYHEQNQLFLWTGDYLTQRLALPGGLADWISECLVQFCYVPWLGALALTVLFTLLALATNLWVGLLALTTLLDLYSLISFPVALLLTVAAARWADGFSQPHAAPTPANFSSKCIAFRPIPAGCLGAPWIRDVWGEWRKTFARPYPLGADALLFPVLYWLVGPTALLYAALRLVHYYARGGRRGIYVLTYLIYILFILLNAHRLLFPQWPLSAAFCGLNYCRVPTLHPACHWQIPLTVLCVTLAQYPAKVARYFWVAVAGLSLGVLLPLKDYDPDPYEVLKQDMLVRQERWDEVIARAERHQPPTSMSSEYVNLALAMKRQLAERMFQFYQSGPDALLMHSMRDNLSNMATAEAFYHLGMINSALRYCSDLQESIVNNRKSGRLERRIALCQLANGRTAVARKHLRLLSHSLYYRAEAEELLRQGYNDEVKRLQRLRYRQEMLYDYNEIDKMLGLLFVNNPDNTMALDYFLGQLLLKGDVQNFMGHLSWAQQYGGYAVMPAGYQDAVRTIQSHGNAPGTLYGNYVKKMMSNAQTEKP